MKSFAPDLPASQPTAKKRKVDRTSLIFADELKIEEETASSLDFVKKLIENASQHQGPLNGDALLLQILKTTSSLPANESKAIADYVNQLDSSVLKKLDKEPTDVGAQLQSTVVGAMVENASKEWARPMVTHGATAVAGFLGGPAGAAAAPFVVKPVIDVAFDAAAKITKGVVKLAEQHTAKQISKGLSAGYVKVSDAASSAYKEISTRISRKKRAIVPSVKANDPAPEKCEAQFPFDETPVLILSKKLRSSSGPQLIEVISEFNFDEVSAPIISSPKR